MVRDKDIESMVGVASAVDKTCEARLGWFKYVKRGCIDAPARRCERLTMVGLKRS